MNTKVAEYLSPNKKNKIEVFIDRDAESPREWAVGTMCCWHKRYNFGDEKAKLRFDPNWFNSFDDLIEAKLDENDVVLPIYMFDHSGIALSTTPFSCTWDSGQLGFTYMDKATIIKEFGDLSDKSKQKAESILISEVEIYGDYVSGNVFYYRESETNPCLTCSQVRWVETNTTYEVFGNWEDEMKKYHINIEDFDISYY